VKLKPERWGSLLVQENNQEEKKNNNNNNNRDATNVEPEVYDYKVIIGATGIVTKDLRKNLEAIPGKHSIDSL
jgi:hypothetical protein